MSKKQQDARIRNYALMRLTGLVGGHYSPSIMTDRERALFDKLLAVRNEILNQWEQSTRDLGFTPRKKKRIYEKKDII